MNLKEQLKLSDIALNNKDFAKAKTLLEEVLKEYPDIFELNFKLGIVNNFLGNLEESLKLFKHVVKVHDES